MGEKKKICQKRKYNFEKPIFCYIFDE